MGIIAVRFVASMSLALGLGLLAKGADLSIASGLIAGGLYCAMWWFELAIEE